MTDEGSVNYHDIGCKRDFVYEGEIYRCVDCGVYMHADCLRKHFANSVNAIAFDSVPGASSVAIESKKGAKFVPSSRHGWTTIHVLRNLVGMTWNEITRSYLRALRPSEVRVSRAKADGHFLTCDAVTWRVTVLLDPSDIITSITQEVEVDLPEHVKHGYDLQCRLERESAALGKALDE